MATRRWSIALGKQKKDITEAVGAAIVTASLELTYDLTDAASKTDVLQRIEAIRDYILEHNWPPA